MDFHSLSRRALQALCKMNKIPANITNLAMADALQALETVEGLEEMLTQSVAGYLETPAKSMAAGRSVSRTSNRQRTKELDSKLTTRSRGGTRKVEGETDAAPPSGCPKVPMAAQSTQRNVESSTAVRVYNTRRSTRLLEKQMCQLSLKDNEDMVDANADKESQDLQRQFIQDIDNSLDPDESKITKEAIEKPTIIENMDVLLEDEKSFPEVVESVEPVSRNDACDVENACNDVEEPINEKEFKNDEDQLMQEDVEDPCNEVEGSIHENNDEQMETVSHPEVFNNGNTDTEEATQELINVEDTLESEADSNADDENSAVPALDPQTFDNSSVDSDDVKQVDPLIKLELSSALIAADNGEENEGEHMNAIQMKAPEASEDEFDFLSESDDDIDENENPLPVDVAPESESVLAGGETASQNVDMIDSLSNTTMSESAEEEASEEVASKSPFEARSPLMPRDQIQGTSRKKPASVRQVPISDNKENFQMMSAPKPVLALPAGAAPGTPLEKKSLRQLKKMVRGLYKQPQHEEETQPAPLQVRGENV